MAYANNHDSGRSGNGDRRPHPHSPRTGDRRDNSPKPESRPQDFPANYVDFAENLMKEHFRDITTSKLRNFLSLVMDVYNTEILRTDDRLLEESVAKLQMARIRIAYECGRDRHTKDFAEAAHLLPWLKEVGDSRENAIRYITYLEAIVAYHRFFGGREN